MATDTFRVNLEVGRDTLTPSLRDTAQAAQQAEGAFRDLGGASAAVSGAASGANSRFGDLGKTVTNFTQAIITAEVQMAVVAGALNALGIEGDSLQTIMTRAARAWGEFALELVSGKLLVEGAIGAFNFLADAIGGTNDELERLERIGLGRAVELFQSIGVSGGLVDELEFFREQQRRTDAANRRRREFAVRENIGSVGEEPFFGPELAAGFVPSDGGRGRGRGRGGRGGGKPGEGSITERLAIFSEAADEAVRIERERNQEIQEERKRFNDWLEEQTVASGAAQLDALAQQNEARQEMAAAQIRADEEAEKARQLTAKNRQGDARAIIGSLQGLLGAQAELQIIAETALAATDFAAAATAFGAFNPVQGVLYLISAGKHLFAAAEWGRAAGKSGKGASSGGGGGGAGAGAGASPGARFPRPADPPPPSERGISGLTIIFQNSLVGGTPNQIGGAIIDAVNRTGERNTGRAFHSTLVNQ